MQIRFRPAAFLLSAALLVGAPGFAAPGSAPIDPNDVTMTVGIGNDVFTDIVLDWVASIDERTGRTIYTLATGPITRTTADGSSFTIGGATFDPDPFLIFSASATNNGNTPQTFSFAFNTPLSPTLSGLVDSYAELGVTLTDGQNNGAAVQPLAGFGTMLRSFDLYSSGGSVSKNVDIGTAVTVPNGTGFQLFTATNSLNCVEACVTMSAVLSFTLTARDAVGFSGRVVQELSPVPLPAAALLLLSGFGGLAGATRLRRRA